ncbi:MAG TPA: T9SS type A sorting domain-containing protein [Bacteroidetes bacterium]|nr:T9SS type A sorting domain-containing protein [Bacteroidota bacterium]
MKKILLAILFSFTMFAAFSQDSPSGVEGSSSSQGVLFEQPSISIYPNPATNFISVNNDENVKTITIFNLVGRKLKSFQNVQKNAHYDVSDLPNGMYLVQVINHSNKIITTQRISKR